MRLRDAGPADVPVVYALQRAYETAWFGVPESSESEVEEWFDLAQRAVTVIDGDRAIGYAARWHTGSVVLGDPGSDLDAVYGLLLPWLESQAAVEVEALDRDDRLQHCLEERGWRHALSAYDLQRGRPTGDDDPLAAPPQWPAGIDLRPFSDADAPALHDLVYTRAGWTDVDGHHDRDYADWHAIFLAGRSPAELPVLAWAGDRIAGAAVLRHFDDGTGWVSQLAVARDHRRRGLGKALLVESLRRLLADGAAALGLNVSASNRGALDLYRSVGLQIHREWRTYRRPDATPGA